MHDEREQPWLEEKLCDILRERVQRGNVSISYVRAVNGAMVPEGVTHILGGIRRCRVSSVQIVVEYLEDNPKAAKNAEAECV